MMYVSLSSGFVSKLHLQVGAFLAAACLVVADKVTGGAL